MLVLGIESSCDETAAAIVRNGNKILSSIISSQIDLHRPFGGVVPELASREHLEKIDPIVKQAIDQANISFGDVDAVAVTQGPGLIGSLLVGVCFAKALAYGLDKPIIGVNHIEGHFYSVVFENPAIEFPALALIVSGGHTNLFYVPEEGSYKLISRTRDDAAGEAFDKVAKMLGMGYPGGPAIEQLARSGDSSLVKFPIAKISDGRPDFSFSGLKTAVARYLKENDLKAYDDGGQTSKWMMDVAASVQESIVRALVRTMEVTARDLQPKTLIVAGGVACNGALRTAAKASSTKLGIPVYFPSKHLSTDNAAMIAAAGNAMLRNGQRAGLDLTADISMRLQNLDNEDAALKKRGARYKL
jgi:N6-L-threonylcarbamoyladenine synthase